MNPLSAFSFGKIIKTLIPGLIASVGFVVVTELIYLLTLHDSVDSDSTFWRLFAERSLLSRIVLHGTVAATVFGAVLLPLSLMLGFLLNTFLWLFVNERFRGWVRAKLEPRLKTAEDRLRDRALREMEIHLDSSEETKFLSLEAFYLPLVDLDKFAYLRESYFSWFEFQANSAAAGAMSYLLCLVTVLTLSLRWGLFDLGLAMSILLSMILATVVCSFLVIAARRNLLRYKECEIQFLTSSLILRDRQPETGVDDDNRSVPTNLKNPPGFDPGAS